MAEARIIAVCGATGRQGGAVARSLLGRGWTVRALTRRPDRKQARAVADLGADVISADMDEPASLRSAFDDVYGVFSVQNGMVSGFDREEAQGRNVADAAKDAGASHLVYGSAGTGETGTGIASWDVKLRVEKHMRGLDLPFTSLRPQALMELMTDKSFYPAVGTWRIWPQLSGEDRPIAWLAAEDVGQITAEVFAQPDRFLGQSLTLVADVQTLAESRSIYREVTGTLPRTFPMPLWLFDRFTRNDVSAIWRWVRTGTVELDTGPTRAIHPTALTVREWLGNSVDGKVTQSKTREGRAQVVHPNVQRLTGFLDAYAAGDQEVIRGALADEAVWHVGGTHRFSGDYRGREAILDYFERVGAETAGTLRLDPIELVANDQRGAAFLRVTAERGDKSLDATMAEAFQFDEEGRISEFWAHTTDQNAVDRFWSQGEG